jgi:iron complex transport system substrate-binding protein
MTILTRFGATALLLLALETDTVASTPRRIASLNLASDEVLAEIVPVDRLVAVTAAADNPEMSNVVGRFPASIVRFTKANLERLIALSPDLVVVSEYTDADFMRALERSGLRAHRMAGLHSLAGIRQAILDLSSAVGEPVRGRSLVARFDARLAELDRLLIGTARPRVLYWSNPFTAGGDTAIGAVIECGGAVNVGREIGLTGVQPLSAERAFTVRPDVILLGLKDDRRLIREHPLLSKLPAVREGHLVELSPHLLATLSQHVVGSCWALAAALHPERVHGAQP